MKKRNIVFTSLTALALAGCAIAMSNVMAHSALKADATATAVDGGYAYDSFQTFADDGFRFSLNDSLTAWSSAATDLVSKTADAVTVTRGGTVYNGGDNSTGLISKRDTHLWVLKWWGLHWGTTLSSLAPGDIITFNGTFVNSETELTIHESKFVLTDNSAGTLTNYDGWTSNSYDEYMVAVPTSSNTVSTYGKTAQGWGYFLNMGSFDTTVAPEQDGTSDGTHEYGYYPSNTSGMELNGTSIATPNTLALIRWDNGDFWVHDSTVQTSLKNAAVGAVLTFNGDFRCYTSTEATTGVVAGVHMDNVTFVKTANAGNGTDWEGQYTCTFTNAAGTSSTITYKESEATSAVATIKSTYGTADTGDIAYTTNLPTTLPLKNGEAYAESSVAASMGLANYILEANTEGQCATKYWAAKVKYNALSETEKTAFKTSADTTISAARTRYNAWAVNQGDADPFGSNVTKPVVQVFANSNDDSFLPSLLVGSFIGVSLIVLGFVIHRHSKEE